MISNWLHCLSIALNLCAEKGKKEFPLEYLLFSALATF